MHSAFLLAVSEVLYHQCLNFYFSYKFYDLRFTSLASYFSFVFDIQPLLHISVGALIALYLYCCLTLLALSFLDY
jgi:hypothetical protein